MDKLIRAIEDLRSKVGGLRKHTLKETPTRTIVIDPLLEALSWDVRDPNEVQLEYPTVDGKSVDYALKLNDKPVLLVEAKPLDDSLNDIKATTQVVGYAANDGVGWCILTNGLKWKVYRTVEACPAPEKLMFEVSLDARDTEGLSVRQVAQQMWRFSRDEMAKGTLDTIGEQTFTDSKVRKALDGIMRDAPTTLLHLVRKATGDQSLQPKKIKESLARIWVESGLNVSSVPTTAMSPKLDTSKLDRSAAAQRASETRSKKGRESYDDDHHTAGKPQEAIELYRTVDRFCVSLAPGRVERRYLAKYISYVFNKKSFCSLHLLHGGLRVWMQLKYSHLDNPPSFARDVSHVGHWGLGPTELGISDRAQLEEALALVRMSFEAQTA